MVLRSVAAVAVTVPVARPENAPTRLTDPMTDVLEVCEPEALPVEARAPVGDVLEVCEPEASAVMTTVLATS